MLLVVVHDDDRANGKYAKFSLEFFRSVIYGLSHKLTQPTNIHDCASWQHPYTTVRD